MSRRRTSRAFDAANTSALAYPNRDLVTDAALRIESLPEPVNYPPPQQQHVIHDVEDHDPPHRLTQPGDRWIVKYEPELGAWATHPRPIGVWATPTRPRLFFATPAEAGDYARSRTRTK